MTSTSPASDTVQTRVKLSWLILSSEREKSRAIILVHKNLTSVPTVFRQKLRANPQFMLKVTKNYFTCIVMYHTQTDWEKTEVWLSVCWVGMCGNRKSVRIRFLKTKPSKNLTSVQTVFRQKLRANPQFMLKWQKITLLAFKCAHKERLKHYRNRN